MDEHSFQDKVNAGQEFALALLKAWGLPAATTKLQITFEGAQPPRVQVEFCPDVRAEPLATVAKMFHLAPVADGRPCIDVAAPAAQQEVQRAAA